MEKIKLEKMPPLFAHAYLKMVRVTLLFCFVMAIQNTIFGAHMDNKFIQLTGLVFAVMCFPLMIFEIIAESIYEDAKINETKTI